MLRALGIALLAPVIVMAAGAAAFFSGVEIPVDFLRPRLERALSAAFGLPTRLEGRLEMRTGRVATLSADALVVADPGGGTGATLARGIRPRARIDLAALLRGTVALDEVSGERLELILVRRADGRPNWAPIFTRPPSSGEPSVTFDGIGHLGIGRIVGSYRSEGTSPAPFEITKFDGSLPRQAPITARGGVRSGGHAFTVDLRTASLAGLGAATLPIAGAIEWVGLRATVEGEFVHDGSRFDARVHATAADAGPPLAALGIAAHEPGPLEARLRLGLAAGEATMRDLALRIGDLGIDGEVGVARGETRPRVTAKLAAGKVDLRPYLAANVAVDKLGLHDLIDGLERIVTGADAELTLSATEAAGLAVDVHDLAVELRSRDLSLELTGAARLDGVPITSSLAYDARRPRRTLTARIDTGRASTAALASAQPAGWAGSAAALRGRIEAGGTDASSMIASAQGEVEARDLRWSIDRDQAGALRGRFDRLRVSLQRERVAIDAAGRIGSGACSVSVSGAALAPLLAGERWPVQGSGRCAGERVSGKGTIVVAGGQPNADLLVELAADRPGPVAGLLGAGRRVPYPLSARGALALDASSASVRFDDLRLGRSLGTGEVAWPRAADSTASVRLAFKTLDLGELGEPAIGKPAPADPLRREMLPTNLPLPDLDFEITAERVAIGGAKLQHARLAGAPRSQSLSAAKFRFDWEGMTVAGQVGADFSGRTPRVEIEAATRDADLRGGLAQLGRKDIGLRAAVLTLNARAQGSRLGDLLASATVDGAVEGGRLIPPWVGVDQAAHAIDFSATLGAAPGQPTRLTATGSAQGMPVRLSLEAGALAELARTGRSLPLSLLGTSGDLRLEAKGKVAVDGSGEARVQLSGRKLERLGALIGVPLPAAEPFAARGNLRFTAAAVHADDLDLSIGRSQLAGNIEYARAAAGRKPHRVVLRATELHLEDIGVPGQLRFAAEPPRDDRPMDQAIARTAAPLLEVARDADVDFELTFNALLGAGQPLAKGRLTARVEAGTLRLSSSNVLTAGGTVSADVRVEASATPPVFAVDARARDLEYGPMLRALDPSASLEGGVDFNVHVVAQAQPDKLLRALSGTVDIATFHRGLRPRALNLWGVGIVNGMLRQLDPDSRSSIDCAVAGLDVERGVARSSGFFVDTTRVRIVGEVEIDLVTRALSGRIDPRSKVPQLLAVAPTMLLGGTVDDPRVSAAPENIVTVPLRGALTMGGLLGDWRAGSGRVDDGQAACREAFRLLRQGGSQ